LPSGSLIWGSRGLPNRETLIYVTLEKHVLLKALALGLPERLVLYVTLQSTFRLALGLPYGEVLIRDARFVRGVRPWPNRKVLFVTFRNTVC
jgi:hypothetical protein